MLSDRDLLEAIYQELQEEGIHAVSYTHFTTPHICIYSPHWKLNSYLKLIGEGERQRLYQVISNPYERFILVLDLADPNSLPTLIQALKNWTNP